jgi:hypothetical protein
MKIGRVDVCDECGAAYTPHTMECSHWRELPPMDVIEWKAITIAPDEREAIIPLPQYQHALIDLESEKFGKFSFAGFEFPVLRTFEYPPPSADVMKQVAKMAHDILSDDLKLKR